MEEAIKTAIETSKQDILEAISIFSTNMGKRFDGVENRLAKLENEVTDGFSKNINTNTPNWVYFLF